MGSIVPITKQLKKQLPLNRVWHC